MRNLIFGLILVLLIVGCMQEDIKVEDEITQEGLQEITGHVVRDVEKATEEETPVSEPEEIEVSEELEEETSQDGSSFELIDTSVDKEAYFRVKLDDYDRICSKINYERVRSECYIMAASLKKDVSICEKVETKLQLSALQHEECLGAVAYATGNTSICDQVKSPNIKYNCIMAMAVYHKNESICNQIEGHYLIKNTCLSFIAQLEKNVSKCKTLKPYTLVEGCYQRMAHITNNISVCEKIPSSKTVFIDVCKRSMTDKLWYRNSCLSLAYNFVRQFCFDSKEEVVQNSVEYTDKSMCDEMSNMFDQRDGCYADVAYATGDESICENVSANRISMEGTCIRASVFKNRNPEVCNKSGSVAQRERCLITAATMLKDVSICDNMNFTTGDIIISEGVDTTGLRAKHIARKNKCYKYVGIALNDISICNKITIMEDRVKCIKQVAKATLNESLCEEINLTNVRSSCLTSMFQPRDNWKYDCAWECGWTLMYTCFYAKDQGILDGMRRHGLLPIED